MEKWLGWGGVLPMVLEQVGSQDDQELFAYSHSKPPLAT